MSDPKRVIHIPVKLQDYDLSMSMSMSQRNTTPNIYGEQDTSITSRSNKEEHDTEVSRPNNMINEKETNGDNDSNSPIKSVADNIIE